MNDRLDYHQTFQGIVTKDGVLKRWSQNGPPCLYPTNAAAATDCQHGEFVVAVKLMWRLPKPK